MNNLEYHFTQACGMWPVFSGIPVFWIFFTEKSISEIHVKSAENRGTERGGDGVEG